MARPSRSSAVVLMGVIAGIGAVIAAAIGYLYYAGSVPAFTPPSRPMPQPNGFEEAAKALARLKQYREPELPRTFSGATLPQLRAQVDPIRPILDEARATLRLQWQTPEQREPKTFPEYALFRRCCRAFMAESIIAAHEGNLDLAMQRSLDSMEMGGKVAHGSDLSGGGVAAACHAIGFFQVEGIAWRLPAGSIPRVLARLRRIRTSWPPLSEILEGDRRAYLTAWTTTFQKLRRETLWDRVRSPWLFESAAPIWEPLRRELTPRRAALANMDRCWRLRIAESKKPLRQRLPVPWPGDAWSRMVPPPDEETW